MRCRGNGDKEEETCHSLIVMIDRDLKKTIIN